MEKTKEVLDELTILLEAWESLPGPILTPNAIKGYALTLCELCPDMEKAEWLIDRIRMSCQRRPAPIEMRKIYATKYKPADGIEAEALDVSDQMGFKRRDREGS